MITWVKLLQLASFSALSMKAAEEASIPPGKKARRDWSFAQQMAREYNTRAVCDESG
ncbi:hypothetical protein L873DRAFT_1809438 [Choiromyces venosus 120613-1]|uniref:SCP domain-containing protein n=1 Tax=Choiromyces venosus 120613-1 TaxID=1336337 RepID=A0A3N4JMK4_9PEZI|nr:hypothetical protein L873DRAFT_1809438 [Choiromyces venosus 120613-1]